MSGAQAVARWFADLEQAWLSKDLLKIKDLISEPCQYFEDPFNLPLVSWDQIKQEWEAVRGQNILKLSISPLVVLSHEGSAAYELIFQDGEGNTHHSHGAYYVKLNKSGRAIEFRQWWNEK